MQLFMRRPHLQSLPLLEVAEEYSLRVYGSGDDSGLANLLSVAFNDAAWTPSEVRERLIDAPDVKQTFVITRDTEIVATASARLVPELYPNSGYVHWVATSPAHAGLRLGSQVTLAALHEFARLGCRDAVLETDDHRLAAIKTYLNLGFLPENREPGDSDCWTKVLDTLKLAGSERAAR